MAELSMPTDQKILKQWARILGYSGTIPFISLPVILLLGDAQLGFLVESALHLYGAIIFSFLGGLHWGRIACKQNIKPSDIKITVLN